MNTLTTSKVGALFALIILTVAFGILPYFLVLRGSQSVVSGRRRQRVIRYLNCFGGGVFIGALLLHLMVEGSEEFDEYKKEAGFDVDFPFFNTFIAAGFFLVAFVEYFMHRFLMTRVSSSGDVVVVAAEGEDDGDGKNATNRGFAHAHEHGDTKKDEEEGGLSGYGSIGQDKNVRFSRDSSSYENPNHVGIAAARNGAHNAFSNTTTISTVTGSVVNRNTPTPTLDRDHEGIQDPVESNVSEYVATTNTASPLRAFLLFVALSFHTLFDGLAVGLQDSTTLLWEMFTAIAIHKCIVGFCLGLELFSKYSSAPRKAVMWMCLFSLVSPVGVCIGIVLTSSSGVNEKARHLSSGVLQGMAGGTFMYVTFFEILSEAWTDSHSRSFLDIFFTLVGFACMAVVKYLDKD